MKFVVQICISVIQIRTSVKKFSVYIIQIQIRVESIQIRHRSGQRLNWMTVLRTCCIFREFERHKFRFEWRQCKFECWENKIEWRIHCAWPKSSKLNAHKMNLVDKITKLTGKTLYFLIIRQSRTGKACIWSVFKDMWYAWLILEGTENHSTDLLFRLTANQCDR